ncbi:hypothetical protein NQ176_g4568 [Zarea fungicola]|uniref:Uncharacterized protein n=1 Tax=Zarea fungicola TaxID=93591 RepID=A0ACC1NCQ1_9HYPO|nr:hypothetical protein NQ176_g4568 [Lecanicillium fungicola]
MARLARVSAQIGCNGFFAFVLADPGDEFTAHGRMFGPAVGIAEDPVTGNACGPLGAYLAKHTIISIAKDETAELAVRQGEAMGRPGTVHVKVDRAGDTFRVRIAGDAVIFFSTTFQLQAGT